MSSFQQQTELRQRTKNFGLRVLRLFCSLPKNVENRVIGQQMLRSGLSVGAQYREACRARSDSELISKLGSMLQELDETDYWFDILVKGEIVKRNKLAELIKEAKQLLAIFTKAIATTRKRSTAKKR